MTMTTTSSVRMIWASWWPALLPHAGWAPSCAGRVAAEAGELARVTVGVGVAGLGRELDVDGLFGAALFLFGEVGEGTLVGFGERRLQDAAGPQSAGPHDVDLGAVQGDLGAQEEPRHQPEHDGEEPIHLLGVLEVVADQIPADRLQQREQSPGH